MATAPRFNPMSVEDYLALEQSSAVRHEFIDGHVRAMTGAHANHNLIAGNVFGEFRAHLKGLPCRPFMSDMKVRIGSQFFYPDVMVDCSAVNGYYSETPRLLVEVLSKSTRRMDKAVKRLAYMQIPGLEEYVLIEQDFVEVEIMRRAEGWQSERYYLGDTVTFASIGLTLPVADIYDRVQNGDMAEWVANRNNSGGVSEPVPEYALPEPEATLLFDGNDGAYLDWVRRHPEGYVLTSSRSLYPAHTVIHRADCALITRLTGNAEPGGFTERGYIKVYSESIPPLRAWVLARREDGMSRECSRCLK